MRFGRRSGHFTIVLLMLMALLGWVSAVRAQQAVPHVGYVFPAGGRQGTTFFVNIGGQTLDGVSAVYISGGGGKGTVVEHTKPLTPKQAMLLKDQMDTLLEKKAAANGTTRPAAAGAATRPAALPAESPPTTRPVWTAEDEKQLMEIRKKLQSRPGKIMNPALAENVTLEITLDANAEPGQRELRLGTTAGLTNPMVFCVGQLPEVAEKNLRAASAPALTLPAVVNGQVMPGEVDRFRIQAKQGQKLVFEVDARALIPFLSDAVPGWFQAAITLYDAKGHELAFADHYRFSPDPVMYFEIPADGEYTVEICDNIYRGREDFVYRLAIGELPYITSVYPLGTAAGTQATVELTGWNLGATKVAFDARKKTPGVYQISLQNGGLTSNRMPFAVDAPMAEYPHNLQKWPNDPIAASQHIDLPAMINGRIVQAGEWHVYAFAGHAGLQIVAEVCARRLDSPLDSVLKLTDAAGKQLAFNDDFEDKGAGLNTHAADSYIRTTLPADGTYYVHIGDAQQKAGPEYAYRLRLSEAQPDFALRVTPSSISVRAGASVPVTVYALRKDGFSDEIPLTLKDAPAGFALSGARIPANQDQVKLTLKAPATHFDEPVTFTFQGRATIGGHEVLRTAVPAEDMMQAFAYHHLVPQQEMLVDVLARLVARNEVKILSPMPVSIPLGGTATVQVGMPMNTLQGKLDLELSDPPDGITIQGISPGRPGTDMVLRCDPKKVKVGLKGNLIVSIVLERDAPAAGGAPKAGAKRRVPVGSLPAIPFEIVGK